MAGVIESSRLQWPRDMIHSDRAKGTNLTWYVLHQGHLGAGLGVGPGFRG